MTYRFPVRPACELGVGFPGGRQMPAGSGQYGGARRRTSPTLPTSFEPGDRQSSEVVSGGGANWENLP
ncbi:hypothetical protein SGPA1_12024 [Streptomyces misionensis JCM 4497]